MNSITELRDEIKSQVDISETKYATGNGCEEAPGKAASVPFMITSPQRQALRERGYSEAKINAMKPDEAHAILGIRPAALDTEAELQSGTSDRNELLAAALDCAAMGWKVFPVYPRDKDPIGAYVPNGHENATTDTDTIRAWWRREPEANIGLWCGGSRIIALDADPHKFGPGDADLLDKLMTDYPTVTQATPANEGRHLFYALPPEITSGSRGGLSKGFDVKVNGYVLLSPSVVTYTGDDAKNRGLPDGYTGSYKWLPGLSPLDLPPQPLPDFVLDLLRPPARPVPQPPTLSPNGAGTTPYGAKALATECDIVRNTAVGGRNSQLYISACKITELVAGGEVDKDEAWPKLKQAALDAGLPEAEIEKTMQSAWRKACEHPRSAPPDRFLLNAGRHDEGNAQCVYRLYGDKLAYCDSLGWLTYTGTHWSNERGEASVQDAIVDTLKRRCHAAIARDDMSLLNAAKPSAGRVKDAMYLLGRLVTVSMSEFDNVPYLLNTANGVVDLRTGELAAHEPSNRFSYCVPVDYVPDAWDGLYHKLMLEWFDGQADQVAYVQRALGYSITGENREECMFYLHGPGRSGKGTMLNTVHSVLGEPIATGAGFEIFTQREGDPQNFRLAPLRNARLVIASESNEKQALSDNLVKQLTGGGDPVQACYKYRAPFVFIPRFKIWLMSNYPPFGNMDDEAFWWRIRLIMLTKNYMDNPDLTLKGRLQEQDERQATLSFLIRGATDWYQQGLGRPAWQKDALRRTRAEQDPLQRFLDEQTIPAPGQQLDLNDLYNAYEQWCTDESIEAQQKNVISRRLGAKGYSLEKKRVRVGKVRRQILVEGIALVP